jgi:hypothetical protein
VTEHKASCNVVTDGHSALQVYPSGATCSDIDGGGAGTAAFDCIPAQFKEAAAATTIAGPSDASLTCCVTVGADTAVVMHFVLSCKIKQLNVESNRRPIIVCKKG